MSVAGGRSMLPQLSDGPRHRDSFQDLLRRASKAHDREVQNLHDTIARLTALLPEGAVPHSTVQVGSGGALVGTLSALDPARSETQLGAATFKPRGRDGASMVPREEDEVVSSPAVSADEGSWPSETQEHHRSTRSALSVQGKATSGSSASKGLSGLHNGQLQDSRQQQTRDDMSEADEDTEKVAEIRDGDFQPARSKSGLSDSIDQHVGDLARGEYVWQWQRSKGGFRSYPEHQNKRIEEAYQNGNSKCRLKSGGEGKTPMEIFFVDMIQIDPASRNVRKVRRLGASSWWMLFCRQVGAIIRSITLGEPRWESLERYKKRQNAVLAGAEATSRLQTSRSYRLKPDSCISKVVSSRWFLILSMLVTIANMIWIGISVEVGEFSVHLHDRHTSSIAVEYGFMVYFMLELIAISMALEHPQKCWKNVWFILDAGCTLTIIVEVLVIPHTDRAAGLTPAIQVLRLVRLSRLLRIFREIKEVVIVLRGIASGMRSAAFIWFLMAFLLYGCSVVLTTAAATDDSDFLREKYFGSLGQSILTLVAHGIALDGVAEFFLDLRLHGGLFPSVVFFIFVFLSYFGLLNMLVGAFCNVAFEVALVEKDYLEIGYLQSHLQSIVECYMDDDKNSINYGHFQLIMKNADVLATLRACGTDLDGLIMLSDVLFPYEDSEITYMELFSVIVRLRRGKPASVSDIIGLQEFTKQRCDKLELLFRQGMNMDARRDPTRSGSVLDSTRVRRHLAHQGAEIHHEERKATLMAQELEVSERRRHHWLQSAVDSVPSDVRKTMTRAST